MGTRFEGQTVMPQFTSMEELTTCSLVCVRTLPKEAAEAASRC